MRTVATGEHSLEILLESAAEGRMTRLILRDNFSDSINVSQCVCCSECVS